MNNKAFSLIELLIVIVLLALISSIGVISYNSIIDNSKKQVYKSYENTMKSSSEMYFIDNPNEIPLIGNTKIISLNELDIEPIVNPDNPNDFCLNSKVIVTRSDNTDNNLSLNYKVCLICNDYITDNSCN